MGHHFKEYVDRLADENVAFKEQIKDLGVAYTKLSSGYVELASRNQKLESAICDFIIEYNDVYLMTPRSKEVMRKQLVANLELALTKDKPKKEDITYSMPDDFKQFISHMLKVGKD
jgi:hypothetical protein